MLCNIVFLEKKNIVSWVRSSHCILLYQNANKKVKNFCWEFEWNPLGFHCWLCTSKSRLGKRISPSELFYQNESFFTTEQLWKCNCSVISLIFLNQIKNFFFLNHFTVKVYTLFLVSCWIIRIKPKSIYMRILALTRDLFNVILNMWSHGP